MPVKKKELQAYQKTLITPATIQRAILDARGELEDKDVFLSSAYHAQLNSLASYIVGRTGRKDISVSARVVWDISPRPITAYTDNKSAVINAAFPKIQEQKRRSDRNMCIMGMACHEYAHCLFTDFKLLEKQYNAFMKGELYPRAPLATPANEYGLKGIQELLDKGKRSREAVFGIYKSLDNAIEDGYIERSIVVLHPGDTKKSLKILNEVLFGGNFMEYIKEEEAKDPNFFSCKWSLFTNALLTMLKLGAVDIDPTYNEIMEDIHKRVSALAPRVMREVENSNTIARKELALDIILENWDLIESEVEYEMSTMTEFEKAMSELTDEELEEILKRIIEAIMEGAGADHDNHEDSNSGIPVRVFIELPSPSQQSEGQGVGGRGEPGEEDDADGSGSSEDSKSDESSGKGDDGKTEDQSLDEGVQTKGKGSSDEGNGSPGASKPAEGKASASNTGESVTIRIVPEGETSGGDDSFRKALNSVEKELAQEGAKKKVEVQLHETLQTNANTSATNDSWRIDIVRRSRVPERGVNRFNTIWPRIAPISKTLKKELLKILQERRRGSKLTGLIHGRRLHTRSLYRSDEKYFSKNRLPNERPKVATALLIDQSGSMSAWAADTSGQNLFSDKIQAASNAAVLLYDFCVDLGFPIMVAGHTTTKWGVVDLEVMASFQKVDKEDKYRICAAGAYSGNRDGTALNYVLTELKKRPEEIKLLFIISDGLPSDYGAHENGVQHLQEVMADAQKSDVLTFAAALDEDIPQLKRIYGENMFEITDLARMPRTLLNVMKRFIK